MVEVLATFTGRRAAICREEVIVGARYLYFDASKAQRDLGFNARPLNDSLRDSLAWYREVGLS